MADIFDLARSINARRKQASQGYASGWEDLPMQVMEIIDTRAKEKRVDNINMAETLGETFKHIKTPEGLSKWKSSLNQLKVDGADDAQIKLMTDMYDTAADEWSTNYTNFTNAVDMGSEFINSEGFSDEEDEWLNLSELAKKNEYDSTVDFISFEKERVMNMMDDLKVGVDGGMSYGGKDKEVIRKLGKYAQSLDLATQTLLGDGIITPEEAQHIAIGDTKLYQADKERALGEAVTMIKEGMSDADSYDKFLTWTDKKEMSAEQAGQLGNFNIDVNSYISNLSDGTSVVDYDSLRTKILEKKELNESSIVRHNTKYKNWAGRPFVEGEFGVETEDDFIIDNPLDLNQDGVIDEEEKLKAKKSQELKLEADKMKVNQEKAKENTVSNIFNVGGADVEVYESISPMGGGSQRKEQATALGEKSYSDVQKNYVPAQTGDFVATNLKWEDADKNLQATLDNYDLSLDDVSSYVTKNIGEGKKSGKDFEKRFQAFLDKNGSDQKARDILYAINPNLYNIKKGAIRRLAGFQPGNPRGAEGQMVGFNKNPSSKRMTDYIKGWKDNRSKGNVNNLIGYNQMILLYNFIGQEKGNK
tara:strand:- start:4240 stop:6003 length:1764 start_codon:yes stop_codon:yes gene_type:complete